MNDYLKQGSDIYRRSFEIIRSEANLARFPADVEPAVVRMVHAAADVSVADLVRFTPRVAKNTIAAINAGAAIMTDTSMVATGIIRSRLPENTKVVCHIKDPKLEQLAAAKKVTKTMAAVDMWEEEGILDGGVVVIGNAPTALFRLLEILETSHSKPAAVIGIPVGFVGAAESKQALVDNQLGLEYFTVAGRRGGSAMAVAVVNAIASPNELENTR